MRALVRACILTILISSDGRFRDANVLRVNLFGDGARPPSHVAFSCPRLNTRAGVHVRFRGDTYATAGVENERAGGRACVARHGETSRCTSAAAAAAASGHLLHTTMTNLVTVRCARGPAIKPLATMTARIVTELLTCHRVCRYIPTASLRISFFT